MHKTIQCVLAYKQENQQSSLLHLEGVHIDSGKLYVISTLLTM